MNICDVKFKSRRYLAANIKFLRSQRFMNQKQLGDRLGVTQTTISEWENGNREPNSIWMLNKICELFEVSLDDLVNHDLTLL